MPRIKGTATGGTGRHRRGTAVLVAAGLAPLLAAGACSSSSGGGSTTASKTDPTVISTAWPADVTSLDPPNTATSQDHSLVRNVYQSLLAPAFRTQPDGSLKYDGAKVKPYLATSWTTDDSSITFHLRPKVTFHGSNNTLDANDVKWSFDRIFETPEGPDIQAIGVQSPAAIHVVDPMTVKLDLTTADGKPTPVTPTALALFTQAQMSIIDADAVKPHLSASDPVGATWLRANTAGTGPYYISARHPGVDVELTAVPNSWAPAPSYPTVKIRITTGSVPSLLQSGDLDVGEYGMTNEQINSLEEDGMSVPWATTGNFDMFAITAGPADQVGALGDKRVRQAIAYALPYQQVLKNVIFDRGERDYSIVSSTAPEYTPAWKQYDTDLTKARSLMKDAGNPKINVPLHYLEGDVDQTNTALLIQGALKSIGITTTLTPQTQAGLFDVLNSRSTPAKGAKPGPAGMELFNWSAWTDDPKITVGYWATTGGANNYPLWSSPEVDATNTTYALRATSAERTAAYKKAQELIAADAPVIPIVATGTVTVVAKGITGVSFSPTGSGRYWTLHPTGTTSALDKLFS